MQAKHDWGCIIDDYKKNISINDICKKYSINKAKLTRGLSKKNIKRRNWSENEIENLKKMLLRGISCENIGKQLNKTKNAVIAMATKLSLKSKFKNSTSNNRLFTKEQVDAIRNKYYLGLWINKNQQEIANYLGVSKITLRLILCYKTYNHHLNLTPEQITALHQEMKAKRKQLREDLENA